MKIIFTIAHPSDVYFFKNIAYQLTARGHDILMAVFSRKSIIQLLSRESFDYKILCNRKDFHYFGIITSYLEFEFKFLQLSRSFRPDCLVGFIGLAASHAGALMKKPSVVITDSEASTFTNALTVPFASTILTPSCYNQDIGKKQIRFAGYKELAYLHPNYFEPDPIVFSELGIKENSRYVILRFGAFDALHDVVRRGFSTASKYKLVRNLEKDAKVFISAEGKLPKDLESYKLMLPYHRVHHAIYYAQLLVCDTGTMASEAAVLGTPAVVCGSFIGEFGNFIELERKYDLISCFKDQELAIRKAFELIQQNGLKEEWFKKRQILLKDKIDVTRFIVDYIENYPESFRKYRKQDPIKEV